MERKRRRSSSGWCSFSASSRTRKLKASQDSSRLMYRSRNAFGACGAGAGIRAAAALPAGAVTGLAAGMASECGRSSMFRSQSHPAGRRRPNLLLA